MYTIYHNPRCTKSRQGVAHLEAKGVEFSVREYLKEPMTESELTEVIAQLGIKPVELLRKGEAIFKEEFKGKDLSDGEWIKAMIEHPKLMERPIIVHNNKAVVARPTERIDELD